MLFGSEEFLMKLRNKKAIALLTFTVVCFVLIVSPEFTGWLVDTISISIGTIPTKQACISIIPSENKSGGTFFTSFNNETNIRTYAENCGNTQLNGTINLQILNSTDSVINETNSSSYSINPFETFNFNCTWLANVPLGRYIILVRDNYTNETVLANVSLDVAACFPGSFRCNGNILEVCIYDWNLYEACAHGCINSACAPAPPPILGPMPPGPEPLMNVEIPARLEMQQNTNLTFLVRVVNPSQVVLHNITLEMKNEKLSVKTIPEDVPFITYNSSVLFLVEVGALRAKLGDYLLYWTVSSTEIKKSGYLIVTVKASSVEKQCRESVEYYLTVMDKLKEQINIVEAEGKNVTYARNLFDETMYELFAAQTFYKLDSYQECISRISIVERNMKEMVVELARAKPVPILVLLPMLYQAVYWTAVALIATFLAFLLLRKIVSKARYERKHKTLRMPKNWKF